MDEAQQKHLGELEELERAKSDEITSLLDQHDRERIELQRIKDSEIEQLRQENASLNSRLNTAQSNYEKE
jgi:cell shape-determining protein MreC